MSSNYPILARNHSSMLAAKARIIFEKEMSKGCSPEISPVPVELEPPYRPLIDPEDLLYAVEEPPFVPAPPLAEDDWVRLKVWPPQAQECDWVRNELLLKQFVALQHRLAFEITGNRDGVALTHLCHKDDEEIVRAATRGFFPDYEFSVCREHPLDTLSEDAWRCGVFEDFFTPPPYSHLLTRPSELKLSPIESLLNTLSALAPPAIGVYQVIIQPTAHDHAWSHNVSLLIDLEYLAKLYGIHQLQQRHAQQAPSGQLNNMADDVETKGHSDKPFFCVAVRTALLNFRHNNIVFALRALNTFMNLFQHGRRPLEKLTQDDYLRLISLAQVRDMFRLGTAYRAGALLNTSELSGLLNIPSLYALRIRGLDISVVDAYVPHRDLVSHGTLIGFTTRADRTDRVCIPDAVRLSHTHILGKPVMGKSSLLEHMCCDDIERGHGVAVIDPHGDLAEAIINRIPEAYCEKVVYFDPGNRSHAPLWNPMTGEGGADRISDDIIRALMQITTGWGHRLETLLRHAVYGLIKTGQGTLADVCYLLSVKSDRREQIRQRILESVVNEHVRYFFEHKLPLYREDDFAPADHKLSKLLDYDTLQVTLSQPESAFNLREIMDTGMVFIANLSTVGAEARDITGSLLLSLFHLAALSRSALPPTERRAFHVYVDEAHRFVTDSLEDMIAETRKYGVSLSFAHQHLSQFENRKRVDALGVVGTTVAFNVTADDAPKVARFLGGAVIPEDLTVLEPREAIARIGNDVVRIQTPFLKEVPDLSSGQRIKEMSYRRYYRPIEELRESRERCRKSSARLVAANPRRSREGGDLKEYCYDEFSSPEGA